MITCCVLLCCFTYGTSFGLPPTDFRKADSIAALYPKHSLTNMRDLSEKLTQSLPTAEEKFRALYKWVCLNIEYDFPLHQLNQDKRRKLKDPEALRDWNRKITARVFKTLIDKQQTVCTGYAYLVKELAFHAGISCEVIDGYGRTAQANIRGRGIVNHSWIAVQLYNTWYLCDPTWSSGTYDTQQSQYVKKFREEYFLADPSLFIRNHYPLEEAWMLTERKPTLHDFLNAPLIYVDAFNKHIEPFFPETFDVVVARGEKISFKLSCPADAAAKTIDMIIQNHGAVKNTKPTFVKDVQHYTVEYVFKGKGPHVVHILFDGNYIVTYEVNVK